MNSDIRKTAELFIKRNGVVEVRVIASDTNVPKKKVIASGYYDDVDALINAVAKVEYVPVTRAPTVPSTGQRQSIVITYTTPSIATLKSSQTKTLIVTPGY